MSYEDIINESDNWRVKLVQDECADEPYDWGRVPILRTDRSKVDHIDSDGRPTDDDSAIEAAFERWCSRPEDAGWKYFTKYLRAYFGNTTIETYWSESYWYVAYDTAAWRKHAGFDDVLAPSDSPHVAGNVKGAINEYKAWCEGDVWGYVVERRVSEQTITRDLAGNVISDDTTDAWEHTDSCFGFYGYDYAKEEALGAMDDEMEAAAK